MPTSSGAAPAPRARSWGPRRSSATRSSWTSPCTLKAEALDRIAEQRPDLTCHRGGIARLPTGQSIDFALLPLGPGEAYACMAETFSPGFSGRTGALHIGDLDKRIVLEVERLARDAGFVLGNEKDRSYGRAL